MSSQDYQSETVRFCPECGSPLVREADGENWCVKCTPVVERYRKFVRYWRDEEED